MHQALHKRVPPAARVDRSDLRLTEETFGASIADVAKLLWPKKTAAEIAALAGCSVRNVEFYLSGEQKWSGEALAVIVEKICELNRINNVRVTARR